MEIDWRTLRCGHERAIGTTGRYTGRRAIPCALSGTAAAPFDFSQRMGVPGIYTVEVDLWLSFCPPMSANSRGIVLTRSITLPFVPTSGVAIFGTEFDPTPVPVGMVLKDIVWEADRKVFLAKTYASDHGTPIALIPYELRGWIDKGWRFGSFEAQYDQEPEPPPVDLPSLKPPPLDDDDEAMERWHTQSPAKRPPEFNLLLKSLVRAMAETFDDEDLAYAIDKTQLVFEDHQLEKNRTPATERFRKRRYEFSQMPQEKQFDWRDRVLRKYPRIQQFVAGC